MPDYVTLADIRAAADALDCRDIRTLEELRTCIGKDVDKSIDWLSQHAPIKQSLLTALLLAEFDDDTGLSGKRRLRHYWRGLKTVRSEVKLARVQMARIWPDNVVPVGLQQLWSVIGQLVIRQRRTWYNWRRHWFDALLVLAMPVLILSLAARAQSINNRNARYVTVGAGAGIPAFQKLTDNLALTNVPYASGAFTSIDQVAGRYTLVNLPAGTTLSNDQVLDSQLSSKMAERRIVSVPLKAGTYLSSINAPCEAVVVLSDRGDNHLPAPAMPFEAIVLRIDRSGDTASAVLAIPKENFDEATSLLASHDAYLAQISP